MPYQLVLFATQLLLTVAATQRCSDIVLCKTTLDQLLSWLSMLHLIRSCATGAMLGNQDGSWRGIRGEWVAGERGEGIS